MSLHDELASRALRALGDQCQIPADVEDRILASLGLPPAGDEPREESPSLANSHSSANSLSPANSFSPSNSPSPANSLSPVNSPSPSNDDSSPTQPSSGVFLSRGDPLTKRALGALEEQCELPPDVADRLLDSLFSSPAPAVALPPEPPAPVVDLAPSRREPLRDLILRGHQESRRNKRIGVLAAASALILTLLVALVVPPRIPPGSQARAPVDVNATQVQEGDPLLDEVRSVVMGMLRDAAIDCHLEVATGVVWFEKTGYVSVLDFSAKRACEPGCVDRVARRFRLGPHDRSILVQLSVQSDAPNRGRDPDEVGQGTRLTSMAVRLTAWWVDES